MCHKKYYNLCIHANIGSCARYNDLDFHVCYCSVRPRARLVDPIRYSEANYIYK